MTKEEKMIELVEQNLYNCVNTTSAEYFTYGSIPQRRLAGAKSKYLSLDYDETVLGLIDTTVMGGGERGAVFTTKGFYIREMLSDAKYISYDNWYCIDSTRQDTYYDFNAISDLMLELSMVEDDTSGGFLNTLAEGAKSFVSDVIDEMDRQMTEGQSELAEICKQELRDLIDALTEVRNTKVDFDDADSVEQFFSLINLWAAMVSDSEKIGRILQEEQAESFTETAEHLADIIDAVDELLDHEKPTLKQTAKKFANKIEDILDDWRYDDITDDDAYDECQAEMADFQKKVRKYSKRMSDFICDNE